MRAGYEIFRRSGGTISRSELNHELFEAGYGPVSERSYGHYRKLERAGVGRYVAINRFDVARASAPYENASANTRYRYVESSENVRVLFARSAQFYEVTFVADQVGDTGAVLHLLDEGFRDGLALVGPRSGDMVSLRFAESGRIESGRVVEIDLDEQPVLLEVEFDRLLSPPLLEMGEARAMSESHYVLRASNEDSTTVDVAGRRVYYFIEFLEGIRSLANLADQSREEPLYSPPSRLDRLRIESSPQFYVELTEVVRQLVPLGLVSAVLGAAAGAVHIRKQWFEGSVAKAHVKVEEATAVKAVHDARSSAAEADLREHELMAKRAEADYRSAVHTKINEITAGRPVDHDLIDRLIDREILPALRQLGESEIESLESGSQE